MASVSEISGSLSKRHSWFPYPAKFPAGAISPFIEKWTKRGDLVVDPFCGSGTVLLEAGRLGRRSVGIELNPVSAAVARAKSRSYRVTELEALDAIISEAQQYARRGHAELARRVSRGDIPSYPNVTRWFTRSMLRELAAVRKLLVVPYKNARIADLLWTAFFKALLAASNQDGDTRYTIVSKHWLRPGYALEQFTASLSGFSADLSSSAREARVDKSAEVFVGDSIEILNKTEMMADLVVTSPPYINTYDYYLYHKHRLFWYGVDPRRIRAAECGNHHRIDSMSRDEAVTEYRNYMAALLRTLFLRMRPGAHAIILVGDGIVKRELIAGDALFTSVALEAGFSVESIASSELRAVSCRFIKNERLDRKSHHIVTLVRTAG